MPVFYFKGFVVSGITRLLSNDRQFLPQKLQRHDSVKMSSGDRQLRQRQNTGDSLRSRGDGIRSLRKRVTEAFYGEDEEDQEPNVYQERFGAYNNFPWEKIRDCLQPKFPHWTDFNQRRVSSSGSRESTGY